MNALDTALAMAKRQGAALTLLHVVNESILIHQSEMLPLAPDVILTEMLRDDAREMLQKIIEKVALEHAVEIKSETVQGFVSPEICKSAERLQADLVVMGSHGASGFRAFFIGTNAYSVVKHANCPVLTVPPSGKWESFSSILFPVRDTPGALEKYDFLRKIIRRNKAVLRVVGLPDPDRQSSENWVEEQIEELKIKLREDDVECHTQLLRPTEKVAEEVLFISATSKIDLIAITATLDYGIRDFFIGPYTQQIVHHAKVPILSIRPELHPDRTWGVMKAMQAEYDWRLPDVRFPNIV